MSSSVSKSPEKLNFEEIIERLSSLSLRLNEEMQSIDRSSDKDQLKRSCDQIEGTKKISAMVFQYFHKFQGDLKKSLNFLESDAEEIINQLPRHQKTNPDLSHYVYHHVNENLMKAESSMQLLHGEASRRKSRAVCARCKEEEDIRCGLEVSLEMSKQSDLPEEIKKKFEKLSSDYGFIYEGTFNLLLPFLVLPAKAEVKRRLLSNLWMGKLLGWREWDSDKIIKEFVDIGIIEPFKKRRGEEPKDAKSFKMQPLIHVVVTSLAEEDGPTNFIGDPPNEYFWLERYACLVQGKELSYKNLHMLEFLFNVNEQFPDLAVTAKQLSEMKRLRVLYLGSWETNTATTGHDHIRHHIEVEDIKFLKAIENMKSLRLLSLQGISLLSKLNVRKLINLRILDLRACWNLSELSDEFDSLKCLTHLDLSGCYFLHRMPPSLTSLKNLQVLKGFVISDLRNSCLLIKLPMRLKKLSIKIVSPGFDIEGFPFELQRFNELRNLKIEWGTGAELEHKRREWLRMQTLISIDKLVFHVEKLAINLLDFESNFHPLLI